MPRQNARHPDNNPRPPRFELNTSRLFLTFPQCDATKEQAFDFFYRLLLPTEYVIAHELHANGDNHLHCYFKLAQPYRTTSPTALDLVLGDDRYHGNYQGCRSAKNVVKYCTKAEDYISNLDLDAMFAGKSSRAIIGEDIVKKKLKLEDLVHEHPQLIFGYLRLQQDINAFQESQKTPVQLPTWLPNPWGWLLPSHKKSKQRHYWIYSEEPNRGKTYHFALPLQREYEAYIAAGDINYWNVDKHTKCIILDDYNTAKLKWDAINQLADGTFGFRVAYRGVVHLDQPLIIILSNQPIRTLYPNMYKFIEARFKEICVDKTYV